MSLHRDNRSGPQKEMMRLLLALLALATLCSVLLMIPGILPVTEAQSEATIIVDASDV